MTSWPQNETGGWIRRALPEAAPDEPRRPFIRAGVGRGLSLLGPPGRSDPVTALNRERSSAQFRFAKRFAMQNFQLLVRASNLLNELVANKPQSESQASVAAVGFARLPCPHGADRDFKRRLVVITPTLADLRIFKASVQCADVDDSFHGALARKVFEPLDP